MTEPTFVEVRTPVFDSPERLLGTEDGAWASSVNPCCNYSEIEATLRARVGALRAAALDGSTESLDVIYRYLAGYRLRDRDLDDD